MTRKLIVEADGGSRGNPGPAGYGALVTDAVTGEVLAEISESIGRATNNVAEYSGLVAGLGAAARQAPGADVEVRMDSKLVVEQMSGRWQIKHPDMRPLAARARQEARGLGRVSYTWVPRERNTRADRLANQAMDAAAGAGGRAARGARLPRSAGNGSSPPGTGPSTAPRTGPGWATALGRPTSLLLLRHGATPRSAERRFTGCDDVPLTAEGLAQARAAAGRLAARGGIGLIVSSPLERARRTADEVSALTGAPVRVDGAWAEMAFGDWDGLTHEEAAERWPEQVAAWVADTSLAPPGGESVEETAARVLPALERLLAEQAGATVVVVSHVTPMKVVLQHALLAPAQAVRRMHLDVACLCEIDWYGGTGVVHSLNDTAHLWAASAFAETGGG